uniref:Uncharacterized protein n=1 Tax=Arundo donax TaxID=35708 RepID=A0A0A8YKW7_ARUDO
MPFISNSFQDIGLLSLTITLWMVSRAKSQGHFERLEQILPQITCENSVSVRNHSSGKAMKLIDDIHK